jgi:hypothetical protein
VVGPQARCRTWGEQGASSWKRQLATIAAQDSGPVALPRSGGCSRAFHSISASTANLEHIFLVTWRSVLGLREWWRACRVIGKVDVCWPGEDDLVDSDERFG